MTKMRPPIFVMGVPRSGTTLVSTLINASKQVYIPEETHFFHLKRKWGEVDFEVFKDNYLNPKKNSYLNGLNLNSLEIVSYTSVGMKKNFL